MREREEDKEHIKMTQFVSILLVAVFGWYVGEKYMELSIKNAPVTPVPPPGCLEGLFNLFDLLTAD